MMKQNYSVEPKVVAQTLKGNKKQFDLVGFELSVLNEIPTCHVKTDTDF